MECHQVSIAIDYKTVSERITVEEIKVRRVLDSGLVSAFSPF